MMVPRSLQLAALLLALCLCSGVVSGFPENGQPSKRMAKWCGPKLVEALHLLCNGVYQQMFTKKSNQIGYPSTVEDYGEDMLQDEVPMFPFQGWRFPVETHLASRGLRVKRGVSDECCVKGCTIAVLQTYCAN